MGNQKAIAPRITMCSNSLTVALYITRNGSNHSGARTVPSDDFRVRGVCEEWRYARKVPWDHMFSVSGTSWLRYGDGTQFQDPGY